MKYNEREIKEQLEGMTVDVDSNLLWKEVGPYAPIKRKRKLLPLFFMFFLGGALNASLDYLFFDTPCQEDTNHIVQNVDSLLAENEILKNRLSEASIDHKMQTRSDVSKNNTKNNKLIELPINNSIPMVADKFVTNDLILNSSHGEFKASNMNEEKSKENEQLNALEMNSEVINIDTLIDTPNSMDPIYFSKQISEFAPKIIINPSNDSWKFLVGFSMGPNFVKYVHSSNEKIKSATSYKPYLSYSVDLGFTKSMNGRFSLGAIINYSNLIYRVNYYRRIEENISMVDTTEISISSNGSTNVIVGNTGGLKITEQKGKIHGYQHRVSIIPTLYYQSLKSDKFRLNHQLGLGIDLMSISRDILPTFDESEYIIHNDRGIKFNPYIRLGTNLEYYISKDLSASILLQCIYRNENYNFSLYRGTRSSIFPSFGLGLSFN